jgi:hypothetical protein
MAGLDPAIHASIAQDVEMDGRLKGGHDMWSSSGIGEITTPAIRYGSRRNTARTGENNVACIPVRPIGNTHCRYAILIPKTHRPPWRIYDLPPV